MPVRRVNTAEMPAREQLVHALVTEWSTPTEAADAPVIVEESRAVGKALHVFVVWGAWRDVTNRERHEIVMDAAEQVKSLDDLMRITQAWALLPDEADRLNVPWR